MNRQEAYRILGIESDASNSEIKKQYRQLMQMAHPDNKLKNNNKNQVKYSAQEINEAYNILTQKRTKMDDNFSTRTTPKEENYTWQAPQNIHAYSEREIYHYVEDIDGQILGNISIAKGKYLWIKEEDFSLFLLSMYRCSKDLLDKCDKKINRACSSKIREMYTPELTYLLAQQFIDGLNSLKDYSKITYDEQENEIYNIDAMLELNDIKNRANVGEWLYPSAIKNHKLYLKNKDNRTLGYLSFNDDRLYYIVIPLFEQKRVQVKLQVMENKTKDIRKQQYQNISLWIKMVANYRNPFPESLNIQIDKILENYMN